MSVTEPSTKRAEANRRNAQKSTGPKTAAGKDRARFNAVKHGMRARTAVLPGEDADAFQARMDAWTSDLKPADEVERFLVARAVQLSWQLERADRALAARPGGGDRVDDLADEVAALGRRLFWDPRGPTFFYPQFEVTLGDPRRVSWSGKIDDPDDPVRLVNRLESTALGCAWLLDRWGELRDALEQGRAWEPSERFKAIRLLGRQPLDLHDDERVLGIYASCTAVDGTGLIAARDLTNELHFGEQKRLADWINRRWPAPEDRPDAEAGRAWLLELVGAEEGRLEELLATRLERPESSSAEWEFDASDASERLRRYQATCDRSLLRVLEALRKRRREAATTPGTGHGPARQKKDVADPPPGVTALLNLFQAVRDRGTTNEATIRPASGPAVDPPLMPRTPPTPPIDPVVGESAAESASGSGIVTRPSGPFGGSDPIDVVATNEPNAAARPSASGWPVTVLTLIAALLSAGMVATGSASWLSRPLPLSMERSGPERTALRPPDVAKSASAQPPRMRGAIANLSDPRWYPLVLVRREC